MSKIRFSSEIFFTQYPLKESKLLENFDILLIQEWFSRRLVENNMPCTQKLKMVGLIIYLFTYGSCYH